MIPASGAAPPGGERPTLRDIARRLGTTATTVSRALRHSPKISAPMRERVHALARELGYRPDPQMARLMHHLRSRRKPRFHGVISALTTRPRGTREIYTDAIIAGARRAADALGYGLEVFHVGETPAAWRGVQRTLASRGVEGLLLLPMAEPVDLGELLDWSQFCAVAATASVLRPTLHRVTPDQFANTKRLCARLAGRGYRRIGLVTRAAQDVRANHAFSAGVTWHNAQHDAAVPALFLEAGEAAQLNAANVLGWLRRARPDAIVTTDQDKCRLIAPLLGGKARLPIGLASTNTTAGSPWTGVDEQPASVGATAIEIVAGMLQRGARGVAAQPIATLLEGAWCEGTSCPPRVYSGSNNGVAAPGRQPW